MRDTEKATSLTPPIAGLSSMGLDGVRDVALSLSLINRLYLYFGSAIMLVTYFVTFR